MFVLVDTSFYFS